MPEHAHQFVKPRAKRASGKRHARRVNDWPQLFKPLQALKFVEDILVVLNRLDSRNG